MSLLRDNMTILFQGTALPMRDEAGRIRTISGRGIPVLRRRR